MSAFIRLFQQAWSVPPDQDACFEGKTVIVTGGNTGLGYAASLKFVQKGASQVILTARTLKKGNAARLSIEQKTGRRNIIEVWELEMTSYDSIRAFVDQANNVKSLDIVVLNAGIMTKKLRWSDYQTEMTLQVNTLSTALLALLLLPKMKASRTESSVPVLEIVSSMLYYRGRVSDDILEKTFLPPLERCNKEASLGKSNGRKQYSVSKMFLECAARALARAVRGEDENGLQEPDVIVTTSSPGMVRTQLGRESVSNFIIFLLALPFMFLFMRSPEQGARSIVSATHQGSRVHGRMWKDNDIQPDAENISGAKGEKLIEITWNELLEHWRRHVPEALDNWQNIKSS